MGEGTPGHMGSISHQAGAGRHAANRAGDGGPAGPRRWPTGAPMIAARIVGRQGHLTHPEAPRCLRPVLRQVFSRHMGANRQETFVLQFSPEAHWYGCRAFAHAIVDLVIRTSVDK